MTALAPHLTAFFQERLAVERHASVNTCDSYAYAFKLLLDFASKRMKRAPSRLELEQTMHPWSSLSSTICRRRAPTVPAHAIHDLPPSNPSCTTWSIACPRPWNKFSACSPSR